MFFYFDEYSIECAGNSENEILFYQKVILPLFKKNFGFAPGLNYYSEGSTYGFRIYCKSLFIFFTKFIGLPIGKKYSKLRIPECFLNDSKLLIVFIRGVFDTDGCISFKKNNKYPTICLSSASFNFLTEISNILKKFNFSFYEVYNYKIYDQRFKKGFSLINRIELNGKNNIEKYMEIIGFSNPKHLSKIEKYKKW